MMRTAAVLLSATLLNSCQKVINVKLQSTEARYVIVGTVTDKAGDCKVSITQTKSFSDDNTFPGVTGAIVTVESNGVVTPLDEAGDGLYQTSAITGMPGTRYDLAVTIGGQTFTASSTMPQPVLLDSLYVSTGPLTTKKYVTVIYKDPVGTANYYRFIQYVNGRKEKSIFADNDEFTDGQKVRSQLEFDNDTDDTKRDILSGDSVRIDMVCTDAAVYKYWYSLNDGASGDSQSASPANPVTNIGGPVMGYFSAQTVQGRTMKVP